MPYTTIRRRYNLVICLLLIKLAAYAQGAISLEKMNVAYMGLPNPITVAGEALPCRSFVLSSSAGSALDGDNECHYIFSPRNVSDTSINISLKTKKGMVRHLSATVRIKYIPLPALSIGGRRHNDSITVSMLMNAVMPAARYRDVEIDAAARIYKYKVVVTRDDDIIFEQPYCDERGPRFDDKTKAFFAQLRPNDMVWITDVRAEGAGKDGQLQDVKLVIK